MGASIHIEQLHKVYREGEREQQVLDNLTLSVQAGEVLALLGRSGSGKSTLLNLIAGIDTPSSGQIVIGDVTVSALDEAARTSWRRKQIGFVFQFFNLIPTLTVEENIRLPLQLTSQDSAEQRRYVHTLLERVGLLERRDSFPERLSGGEQQRIAIMRALAHQPQVLLADEPTGNLDHATGQQVLDLLLELSQQHQTTLVLVTHSDAVAQAGDKIMQLQQGQLMEVVH